MKIDFDALDLMVQAGATGPVILAYLRALDAKQAPKRAKDRRRKTPKTVEGSGNKRNGVENGGQIDDQKKQVYARAEQVCGAKSGGLVTSLIKSHAGDVAYVGRLIETASTTHSPRDYLNGMVKGAANGTIKGAFAELRLDLDGSGGAEPGDAPMRDITPTSAGPR